MRNARRVRIKPPMHSGHFVSRAGEEGTVVSKNSLYCEGKDAEWKAQWDLAVVFDARGTAEGYYEWEVEDV